MKTHVIRNATVVNEGRVFVADLVLEDGVIAGITEPGRAISTGDEFDATGLHLLPGMIDDQVHFREPGLTHKAEIATESKAAVAGGITSFMEMPNTVPNTVTQERLQEKYDRAAIVSPANYSFYMGVSNDNLREVLKTDPKRVCGIKVFMGSSTGNMLVDDERTLSELFREAPCLIATHCEDEATIRANMQKWKDQYGEDVPMDQHPLIRSAEACYRSSSTAVELAEKFNTRLHILHISTARETELFKEGGPFPGKHITAEACIHHLWFSDSDYRKKGSFIKWNPAVKTQEDRQAVRNAVREGRIDVIATDHAPHALEEKQNTYFNASSGGPLVQHAMMALFDLNKQGVFTLEQIAEKTSHSVANCYNLKNRGFIREGYAADLILTDLNSSTEVTKESLLYKCGWSPFEGHTFSSSIIRTYVNGHPAYSEGEIDDSVKGQRLEFDR